MPIFKTSSGNVKTAALTATAIFLCLSILYFTPAEIPFKLAFPLASLTIASLWLCPWQITLAMLCSALGDLAGSQGFFLGQMGSFLLTHIWLIWFFCERYLTKVEHDRKLTAKAKGYMAMITFCIIALLAIAFTRIIPEAPAGLIRTGAGIYACVICLMLFAAMLQRSSLYALGALLFVFSDFILAWNKFVEPIPQSGLLILIPYYLGQWLLFIRSTSFRIAPEMRILRF